MLKIVYPICCGIDVHKSFLVACIASTNEKGVTSYKSRRFSTFSVDLRLLQKWLADNDCKDVCMESTGKYWIPVYNVLESTCNIVLAHPKYVKAIREKKTDKKDAKWISDIFKHDLVSGSFIHLSISDSCVILCVTETNSPDLKQVKKIVRLTVLLFQTSNLMMFSVMFSAKLLMISFFLP